MNVLTRQLGIMADLGMGEGREFVDYNENQNFPPGGVIYNWAGADDLKDYSGTPAQWAAIQAAQAEMKNNNTIIIATYNKMKDISARLKLDSADNVYFEAPDGSEVTLTETGAKKVDTKQEITDIRDEMTTVSTQSKETTEKMQEVSAEMTAVSGKMDTVTAEMATVTTDMEGVKSDIATTNTNLDTTKTDLANTKTDLSNTQTELTATKTTVTEHTTSIDVIDTILSRIYDPIGYLRDSIAQVTNLGTNIVLPNLVVKINGKTYSNTSMTLNVNTAANWDNSTYATRTNRAGANCYLYACMPTSGTTPVFKLSVNSTVPTGYTTTTSRKIGGFHCECVDIPTSTTWVTKYTGATSAHALAGLLAGNIIPASIWDLWHRPKSDVEGMLYSEQCNIWVDIYLAGWDGSQLVSRYGATTADGTFPLAANPNPIYGNAGIDGETMHILAHHQGKRSITRDEFVAIAEGSNERTAISGSKDWTTTGGHVDTANRRMVSNLGCEDCCGFLWQWTSDFAANGASGWDQTDVYSGNAYATNGRGSCYGALFGLLVGGDWGNGSSCGSACVGSCNVSASRSADRGGRLVSEPLHVRAV